MQRAGSERQNRQVAKWVTRAVKDAKVEDIHTHLYAPAFGPLLLWGIDELLTYHYLVAEAFRHSHRPYDEFWNLPKRHQAEWIWQTLFVDRSPLSESTRGLVTILNAMGLETKRCDLEKIRSWFTSQDPDRHVDRCMELAGVKRLCMTNSPFDELELPTWMRGYRPDSRFSTALRIDPLLLSWPVAAQELSRRGYSVSRELSRRTLESVKRWTSDWIRRMDARYVMVSLPPDFAYPSHEPAARLLAGSVLPVCADLGIPFALMPGVKRAVNPQLRLAGDGVALSNLDAVEQLCSLHPKNRFLITVLSRENQHQLCVLGRKFRNLHLFGCWWFTNVPVLIDEITRMRLELLGPSFTAQHSDARVLEQIVYKWSHSRDILARVLVEKYQALAATGWPLTPRGIERDVDDLLGGAFGRFCEGASWAATARVTA